METIYFYEKPKLNGYNFRWRRSDFKYGVEFNFFDEKGSWDEPWRELLFPLVGTLIEIYGHNPSRYEFLSSDEDNMYRIYFKDEDDQAAFKLLYPGEWDPDPVWGDEDE